jgi:hypothetical protein
MKRVKEMATFITSVRVFVAIIFQIVVFGVEMCRVGNYFDWGPDLWAFETSSRPNGTI